MKLEVGMYVRTTYGIGKINKAFIIYSDDGYLWMLCYMTDNPKIEIGIYTKELMYGGEMQKDHNIKYEPLENKKDFVNEVYKQELDEPVCYVPVKNGIPRNAELFDDHKFIKSSFNIIDLIEVGDIIQWEIIEPYRDGGINEVISRFDEGLGIYQIEADRLLPLKDMTIKSIVTHDQFDAMKYEVK